MDARNESDQIEPSELSKVFSGLFIEQVNKQDVNALLMSQHHV